MGRDDIFSLGPPYLGIQINGSSYTHGQQLPTMSIVPAGSPGSYSKSARYSQFPTFRPGRLAPISFNPLTVASVLVGLG